MAKIWTKTFEALLVGYTDDTCLVKCTQCICFLNSIHHRFHIYYSLCSYELQHACKDGIKCQISIATLMTFKCTQCMCFLNSNHHRPHIYFSLCSHGIQYTCNDVNKCQISIITLMRLHFLNAHIVCVALIQFTRGFASIILNVPMDSNMHALMLTNVK